MKAAVFIMIAAGGMLHADIVRVDTVRTVMNPRAGAVHRVDVDNLIGHVEVVGSSRRDVLVTAVRTTRVRFEETFPEADREVTLEMKEAGTTVVIFVDAPWRVRHGMIGRRLWRYGFEVTFDIRIEMPSDAELAVRTVEDGDVRVKGVSGPARLENVNGDVTAEGLCSTSMLFSVNGDITATFDAVPDDDCGFRSVNGTIEVAFPATLNGTFAAGSWHGDIYTDFDFQPAPRTPVLIQEGRTWKRLSATALTRVNVGNKGPEYRFETLNGSIYILKRY